MVLHSLLTEEYNMFKVTIKFFNTKKIHTITCKDKEELVHDLKYIASVQDLKSISIQEI
jgi:hypothetical protein